MHHMLIRALLLLAIPVLYLGNGCGNNPVDAGTRHIFAGTSRELGTRTIAPSGGSITLNLPGDSLDGLTIDVPDGAYPDARTFTISSAPIQRHEFGADFNALTPLIKIENGGGYADEPMTLTIPCRIPQGHFAMAFMYDRATGRLEGMPLIAYADTSLTVVISHFSLSTVAAPMKTLALNSRTAGEGSSEIVITSVPEQSLASDYDSGFRPGVDDWQFTNWGSHAAPEGQCAGQSITMMWYYSARKKQRNDEPLNGRFDNDGARTTPQIWQDDVAGYRFASVAQVEHPWITLHQIVQTAVQLPSDRITYNLFAYAIRLTGEPQFISISYPGADIGHAMVVYRVANSTLYIADPNYPGGPDNPESRERIIPYSSGTLLPYYSGSNASNLGTKYTFFLYFAQSSIVDYNKVRQRWNEVHNGTIGADLFPTFTITARDESGNYVPLTDGFTTKSGTLRLGIQSQARLKIAAVYDDDEKVISFTMPNVVQLGFGSHLIGFYVVDETNYWVGFQWIRVESKGEGPIDDPNDPPLDKGSLCATWLADDSVGQLVQYSEFNRYADKRFSFIASYYLGSIILWVNNFNGVGTYPLFYNPLAGNKASTIMYTNHATWPGNGTLTITRWDVDSVAGSYTFESTDPQGAVTKRSHGQFQCGR